MAIICLGPNHTINSATLAFKNDQALFFGHRRIRVTIINTCLILHTLFFAASQFNKKKGLSVK